MKKAFAIKDKKLIEAILNTVEYGVLALCADKPYAVPVNFVYVDEAVYFHGSPKGKKMGILRENNNVSLSVVADDVIIPSYFSSTEGLACPATSFFKSIIIDGAAEVVETREVKVKVFEAMMGKLQPEGQFTSFESSEYDKQLNALAVVKINVLDLSAKFKFGQNLNKERFQMIVDLLEKRGRDIDLLTIQSMKALYTVDT